MVVLFCSNRKFKTRTLPEHKVNRNSGYIKEEYNTKL